MRGSAGKVHSNYHVPISNTATGFLVLHNQPEPAVALGSAA